MGAVLPALAASTLDAFLFAHLKMLAVVTTEARGRVSKGSGEGMGYCFAMPFAAGSPSITSMSSLNSATDTFLPKPE